MSLDVGALYEQHQREIARFVGKRMTGAAHPDADDVAQHVWERALRAAGRYHDRDKPKAWLLTIARNLVTDYFQSPKWQRRDVYNLMRDEQGGGDFYDSGNVAWRVSAAEPSRRDRYPSDYAHLYAALDDLTPEQRSVVELFYWHGLPFATIAEQIGMTENGVKKLAIRARARMRRHLERTA